MIRDIIMEMAQSDPQYAQAIDAIEAQVAQMPIVPEDLDEAIQLLEFVIQNPDKYAQVREAAIKDGVIDPGMFPEQYDQVFIVSLLVALYGLQDRLKQQGYARGGLAAAARHVAAAVRGGDTMLAHINHREAEMLKRMGGSGTVNPHTGLHEYKSKFFKILGKIVPIALNFIPGVGTAISGALTSLGVGATAASIGAGALMGAAGSAIGGTNVLQGALMGGLGAGAGGALGGAANKALGLGLSSGAQNVLGSGLLGGALGAATGKGFMAGATQGALGGVIGNMAGGVNAPNAFQQGVQAAGKTFGNALAAGYDPREAALTGLSTGIMRGVTYKPLPAPSTQVVDSLKTGQPPVSAETPISTDPNAITVNQNAINQAMTGLNAPAATVPGAMPGASAAPAAAAPAKSGFLGDAGKYLALASAASSLLSSAPPEVQEAVTQLSPQQQEYFNRPSVAWDWNRLQQDAAASGMGLSQYMANNWNRVTGGSYNTTGMAHGGALSAVSRFARGAGSGRDDLIDAKLSDGEYVMDAETVSMLGDGSSKEGARRLEEMRKNIRQHKGKTLAKGKFSPNAKSPLSYLKGAA